MPQVTGTWRSPWVKPWATFRHPFKNPARRIAEVTGATWEHLWLGRVGDVIGGVQATPSGGAVVGIPFDGLDPGSELTDAMYGFTSGSTARLTAMASIGDVTTRIAVAVVFRTLVNANPSVNRSLFGHRDAVSPNLGWEVVLLASGALSVTVDAGSGAQMTTVTVPGSYADGVWHALVFVLKASGVTAGSESATTSSAGTFVPITSPATLSWASNRLFAPGCHEALVALSRHVSVESIAPQAAAAAILADMRGSESAVASDYLFLTNGDLVTLADATPVARR